MRQWMIGVLLMGWAQAGFAATFDVGMLTQMNGKVEIVTVKEGKHPATAFLKVSLGDKLVLGRDARVQIVYFETSRQEVWKGAGEVEIGNGEGRSSILQPETKKLPPLLAKQLAKTPAAGRHGKSGMMTVRSLSSDTVESLEKQYREFRGAAADDDTTPEVFLLTRLLEVKEFGQAQTVLEGLRARLSATPALEVVISHFDPLVRKAAAGQ